MFLSPFRASDVCLICLFLGRKGAGRREWHKGAFNSRVISFWSEIQYFLTAAAPFRTRSASLPLPELSAPFLDRERLGCVHGIERKKGAHLRSMFPHKIADEPDVDLNGKGWVVVAFREYIVFIEFFRTECERNLRKRKNKRCNSNFAATCVIKD